MRAILDPRGNPARTVRAQYEAAVYSPTRSGVWWPLRDAKDDTEAYTRNEIARFGWHLYQNSPVIRGLIERLSVFTVGTGIHPFAGSSDAKWNDACDQVFEEDGQSVELENDLSWWETQDVICRGMFTGGDCLSVHVNVGETEMPKLALFESHQIGAHRLHSKARDGIMRDAYGRVLGYISAASGEFFPRPLAVLHWMAERPGQCRGVSVLASAINTARDLEDILKFEKDSVAENSRKTEVIESATGAGPSIESAYAGQTWTMPDGKTRREFYQRVIGSTSKVLEPGDKYVEVRSDRPSEAWRGFVKWLAASISQSTGFPDCLISGESVGGADTRREAAIGQRVAERFQYRIAGQMAPILLHRIQLRINDGTLSPAPEDWKKFSWQFPKALTVDAGREAMQDREDVRAGLLSEEEYHGRYSANWKKHRKQVQTEARDKIKRAKWLAQDEGIPFELALSLLGYRDDAPVVDPTAEQQAAQPPARTSRVTE